MRKLSVAERSRRYRERHRDEINARRRLQDANRNPEEKARRYAKRRQWYKEHHTDAAFGMGKGYKKDSLCHILSSDELKAHRYAKQRQWWLDHPEKYKARLKLWASKANEKRHAYRAEHPIVPKPTLSVAEKKRRKADCDKRRRQLHYQECLEKERLRHQKHRDKTRKRLYMPKFAYRIPSYVTSPAEARFVQEQAIIRKRDATVPFMTAMQSGLSCGHYTFETLYDSDSDS